jgi:hypothetical protein
MKEPLFAAFLAEWQRAESEQERTLAVYVLFALNDPTVAGISRRWLFDRLRRAPSELRIEDLWAAWSIGTPAFLHRSREWSGKSGA